MTRRFANILGTFDLKQHVRGITHKDGHTHDLVITRCDDSLVQNIRVCDPAISDHRAISIAVYSWRNLCLLIKLLGRENVVEYPKFDDKIALANKLSDFFIQNIDTIQTKLDNMVSTPPLCIANERVRDVPSLEKFNILSLSDVRKLIKTTPKKSCLLDPTLSDPILRIGLT